MTTRFSRLPNGLKIITESLSHVGSVSLGIWLDRGARAEIPSQSGLFHFIEHTVFKGTPTRGARAIAEAFDGIGGSLDAYTGKEETCFSMKVREKHLALGLEILCDMLANPLFAEEDLDRERQVILEEMKMVEDTPEDAVFEHCMRLFWPDHSMGYPILGSPENIARFSRNEILNFHRAQYQPERLIVAAAGKLDHQWLVDRLESFFATWPAPIGPGATTETLTNTQNQTDQSLWEKPRPHSFQRYIPNANLEQINFCINFPGLAEDHPRKYALQMLSTLLGGGMSSRLFQKIREEHGLVYQIGSFAESYSDCGQFTICGGCAPERFEQVIDLSLEEIRGIIREGVSSAEVDRAREQCVGSFVMGLESTFAWAAVHAKSLMAYDRPFELARTINELETVTGDEIMEVARELFTDQGLGIVALGRLKRKAPKVFWRLAL